MIVADICVPEHLGSVSIRPEEGDKGSPRIAKNVIYGEGHGPGEQWSQRNP